MPRRDEMVQWVHTHPELTNAEKRLALYLIDYTNTHGVVARLQLREMAEGTAMTVPAISRALSHLVGAGVLGYRTHPPQAGKARKTYFFLNPAREAVSA